MSTKVDIRRIKKAERDAIPEEQRREWSSVMADTMTQTFEYQQCSSISTFMSFGSEPDTKPLIERAWSDGKSVFVPAVDPVTRDMQHVLLSPHSVIVPGEYGIPEPADAVPVNPSQLDATHVAVVPLLAFNELLYRIGYGKGYYDRFLAKRVFFAFGYAFTDAFSQAFEPESHDERLDAIVTEQGIVRTRRSTTSHVRISW